MTNQEKTSLEKLIAVGKIQEAIDQLLAMDMSQSRKKEVLSISAKYSELKRKSRAGVLSSEQKDLSGSRITAALLDFINDTDIIRTSAEESSSGQQINGVIYYQNSGGIPAEGVEVSAFDCDTKHSQPNGMFTLNCPNKKAGQKIKLIFGSTDKNGKNIEVINTRQLEFLRFSNKPQEDSPVEIIICNQGERNKASLRFYGILAKSTNKEYEQKLNSIESQLKQNGLNNETTRILIEQIDELKKERDAILEKLKEQAQFIASINKDRASLIVKSAIQKIEQEEDTDAALSVLNDAKLDEAYQSALEKRVKAEAEIQQVIEGYEFKASLLLPKFKYKEACSCYEKIIKILKSNNFSKEAFALLYIKVSNVYYDDGKYDKALIFQKKSINIREEVLDIKHPDLTVSYSKIGKTYKALGQYDKALAFLTKVIDIREEILDPNHSDLATSYNNIAAIYELLGQHKKALEFHEKSINILENISEHNDRDLGSSYDNIAITYQALGQYDKALTFFIKSMNIFEFFLDPKHPNLAISYSNISAAYQTFGQYDKALEFQKKSINIFEEILDSKHPNLAKSYNNISAIYHAFGQYEKALEFQKKSINTLRETLGYEHPILAAFYNNIAMSYRDLAQYGKALEFQKKAINIQEKILDPKHPNLASFYSNIALNYQDLGQYDRALEFQKKSISIWKEVLDLKHPNLAIVYGHIATTYRYLKEYKKALDFHKKAINIQEKTLDAKHFRLAISYDNVSVTYRYIEEYKKAIKFHEKAIKIQEEILDSNHPNLATSYNNIALTYQDLGQYEKALEFYKKAFNIQEEVWDANHPNLIKSYNNIGMAYAKNKQFKEAEAAFTAYEKIHPKAGRTFRNWAMYHALQNDKTKAIENLKKAIELGYDDIEWLETDDSMDSLRGEKAFIQIIQQLKKNDGDK